MGLNLTVGLGAVPPKAANTGATADPRLPKAAQEFEAMLMTDLLKMGSEDKDSDGELGQSCQGYDDLRNQAVATAMAKNGGIGIARMLMQKLGGNTGTAAGTTKVNSEG
jgi:Rod binding domain-containing protein